jgi:hypothetical protein
VRNMSYIKPLSASIGPKSVKCEIRDETIHCDYDDFVSTVTTTRTPDVPSGGVFSVKTRTCITWASSVSSRVVVTSQVEWTGRSFIKGASDQVSLIVESRPDTSCSFGQQGSSKSQPSRVRGRTSGSWTAP